MAIFGKICVNEDKTGNNQAEAGSMCKLLLAGICGSLSKVNKSLKCSLYLFKAVKQLRTCLELLKSTHAEVSFKLSV